MRILSVCLLLALPMSVFLASIEMPQQASFELQQLETLFKALQQTKSSFDIVLNLLPIYGWIKLKWFMTRWTLDKCYKFMKDHPEHWATFTTEMAGVGVTVPPLEQIDLKVIQDSDFKIVLQIVGETTIKDAISSDAFLKYVSEYMANNRDIGDLGKQRLAEAGFVLGDDLNDSEIWNALVRVAESLISDFLPTAIAIVSGSVAGGIIGKRDLSTFENAMQLELLIKALQQTKGSFDMVLNLLPIYGWIKLKWFMTRWTLDKCHKFMKDHPEHWATFTTEMAAVGVTVPPFEQINLKVLQDSDFKIVLQIVGETTIKEAISSDAFLKYVSDYMANNRDIGDLGKQRLTETGFVLGDDLNDSEIWNALVRVAESLISDFLPTAIAIVSGSVAGGIIGKRDLTYSEKRGILHWDPNMVDWSTVNIDFSNLSGIGAQFEGLNNWNFNLGNLVNLSGIFPNLG